VILSGGNTIKGQREKFDAALAAARDMYTEIMLDFEQDEKRAKLEDIFFKWYFPNEPLVLTGWRILAVEKEFNLEYDSETHATYPFVVDIIALSPEGKTVVIDHKFVWDFYTFDDAALQPQIPKYIGALRGLGYTIDYGMYNMVRTRRIVGTKSKAHPDGAGPTLEQMLQTMELKPNSTRVTRTFMEQIGTAREIQALKELSLEEQDAVSYRTANKMVCQSCSFRDLCTTELVGGNTKLMIATEYTVRERREFDSVSEDVE
jgi:hypothetical protein